jgi:hypothetical protein
MNTFGIWFISICMSMAVVVVLYVYGWISI